ncbi:MAG: Gfo/Idh/MocA family oxidoreductase [Verrucomicrobiales bacterium]|nr:Gfo/Idh/MocA family oxidoreductase [Verrucomicrobiales bacterium]
MKTGESRLIEVLVVGCGHIATTFHIPAWTRSPHSRVSGCVDVNPECLKNCQKEIDGLLVGSDLEAVIKQGEFDVVHVCSPNTYHFEHSKTALENGCHVLVEKPMCLSQCEVEELGELALRYDRRLMCGQHQRFRQCSIRCKQLIDSGKIGVPFRVEAVARNSNGVPKKISFLRRDLAGGGPGWDLGSHLLDASMWFLGCFDIQSSHSYSSSHLLEEEKKKTPNLKQADIEDFLAAQLVLENGAFISLETSYLCNSGSDEFYCAIHGSEGTLIWPDLKVVTNLGGETESIEVEDHPWASDGQVTEFLDWIEGRREDSPIPLDQTTKVVKALEKLYASCDSLKK